MDWFDRIATSFDLMPPTTRAVWLVSVVSTFAVAWATIGAGATAMRRYRPRSRRQSRALRSSVGESVWCRYVVHGRRAWALVALFAVVAGRTAYRAWYFVMWPAVPIPAVSLMLEVGLLASCMWLILTHLVASDGT